MRALRTFLFGILILISINGVAVELSDKVYKEIEVLSEEGNRLADLGKYEEAKAKFLEAFKLLPEPATEWEACTWLLASIGDMSFSLGQFEKSKNAFNSAMHCPDAIGNPFLHLRLGQSQLELGNEDRAADELARAYMGAGTEIFKNENPKYFEFLKTVLTPPSEGGW